MDIDNSIDTSSSLQALLDEKIASRLFRQDATIYDFSSEAQKSASQYLGWTNLSSNPPTDPKAIQKLADEIVASGIETAILIGQGGSTQAPMTITKYNKLDSNRITFKTIDSDSPVRVREILCVEDLHKALFIVASKSGNTIEPRLMQSVFWEECVNQLGEEETPKHFVAITDPGSALEQKAKIEGWRAVLLGKPSVGGRFSALSVFGLFPAALVGIDICEALSIATQAEIACSQDSGDNPAVLLASFLYDNYVIGRNKFSFLTPKRGRVFGLWIEQLVAESLGKDGKGILPNIEIDPLILANDPKDLTVIMYETKNDLWDERINFNTGLAYVDRDIPCMKYRIDTVYELFKHFIMWEYAIAMCGFLMKVCPFDQPDVSCAKSKVLEILQNGQPDPDFIAPLSEKSFTGSVEVRVSSHFEGYDSLEALLRALFASFRPGDYFALNAFLPFTGEYRREMLESIRHTVASKCGVASCLEVGPRYLHSTGQLQKGGPNSGVFLIISSDEVKDIALGGDLEAKSLGVLAESQAIGDWMTLEERGRRCVHLHLPDNAGVTLRALCALVVNVLGSA